MIFKNRTDAGKQLGLKLKAYLAEHPELGKDLIIAGLPRGGVPVAKEVARILGCKLQIICAKKIPCPGYPEYAIGAVSADGAVVLNPDIPHHEKSWQSYVERQTTLLVRKTTFTENQFHHLSGTPKLDFHDKIIIIVDDGIATGMTVKAAVKSARNRGARRAILATPVMSAESDPEMKKYFDDVVTLVLPPALGSVGQFYEDFTQTTNEEVVEALRNAS
jgi:putative phosphoribosyl transferase